MSRLGDVLVDIKPGFASRDNLDVGVFQFRMHNFTRESALDLTKRRRVNASPKQMQDQSVAAGDVLFNSTNSPELVGKSALIGHLDEPAVFSNHFLRLRTDPDRLDPSYLAQFLRCQFSRGVFRAMAKAWVNQATVGRDRLEELDVPLPPLPEQRRIAAILGHADALRAKRRQVLAHLDALTQSIFSDMFGDLRQGRWDHVPFGELVPRVENGTSPKCEARPAGTDEWAVLKLGAVTYGVFRPEENKAFLGELGSMTSNEVRSGDVLMTRKNTRDLVGAVALADEVRPRLLLPDLIFRLHLDEDRLNRRYFQALMMNPHKRPAVRDLSSGSASSMPNISKARLAGLPLELPPLALQQQFAARAEFLGSQRAGVEAASRVDDSLFASLQSRAFRGEL